MTIQSGADPRDAEVTRPRALLAEREAEIAADDALLAERNRILDAEPCPTHGPCVPHVLDTLRTLRAQLAAAQADNAALRGVIEDARDMAADAYANADVSGLLVLQHGPLADALATPAPGAPLLDAVRGVVKAAAAVLGSRGAGCGQRVVVGSSEVAALEPALAAVRAVLPK